MLLELLVQVSYDTKPFVGLVGIIGLPIVLDVVGLASRYLIDITYEPIGVVVFAVGVFHVYVDRFRAIGLAGGRDTPLVVLNAADHIRHYSGGAVKPFPN